MRIAIVSDYHSGHKLGLTPPEWQRPDCVAWLGPLWTMYADWAESIGRVDAVIANGDLIDGPGKKDTAALLETDLNIQIDMAVAALSLIKTKRRYIVRGTGYHTDLAGSQEDHVAHALDTDATDEVRLEVYNRKLHARHVVGRSDTPYGQYTQIQKEVINEMLQAEFEDYEDADILVRSHVHYNAGTWVSDSVRGFRREAFTTPALQLRLPLQSPYTRKLRTWLYHVGGTVLTIDKKRRQVEIDPVIFPIRLYAERSREYERIA